MALLHENHLFVANAKENSTYVQAWFMPCVHPDRVDLFQFFSFADGDFLDIATVNEWVEEQKALNGDWTEENKKALLNEPTEPPPLKPLATPNTATKSPILAFNETYTVHKVLIRNGYKRATNGKYLSPKSSTKEAGVIVLEDDKHIISYHNDVLNDGKSHDAFDCYRLLECGGDKVKALNWEGITRQNRRDYMRAKDLSKAQNVRGTK